MTNIGKWAAVARLVKKSAYAWTTVFLGSQLLGAGMAYADSPLNGTWYNSFCSRVDLAVSSTGQITGQYTSHTGSTGTSNVVGQVNPDLAPQPGTPTNPSGIPFSMGIQWRLINVPVSSADGSWHWVSTFSGQYHQNQTVSAAGQQPYTRDETLVLLNGLIATATLPPLAKTAPLMWPQTLEFQRKPPTYCEPLTPGKSAPYTPTAQDNVSGSWKSADGQALTLTATLESGAVSGVYTDSQGVRYNVFGLFDTLVPGSGAVVAAQGVTLSIRDPSADVLKAAAGGVDYSNLSQMWLWTSDLKSTTWTDRFTQETLDKTFFENSSD